MSPTFTRSVGAGMLPNMLRSVTALPSSVVFRYARVSVTSSLPLSDANACGSTNVSSVRGGTESPLPTATVKRGRQCHAGGKGPAEAQKFAAGIMLSFRVGHGHLHLAQGEERAWPQLHAVGRANLAGSIVAPSRYTAGGKRRGMGFARRDRSHVRKPWHAHRHWRGLWCRSIRVGRGHSSPMHRPARSRRVQARSAFRPRRSVSRSGSSDRQRAMPRKRGFASPELSVVIAAPRQHLAPGRQGQRMRCPGGDRADLRLAAASALAWRPIADAPTRADRRRCCPTRTTSPCTRQRQHVALAQRQLTCRWSGRDGPGHGIELRRRPAQCAFVIESPGMDRPAASIAPNRNSPATTARASSDVRQVMRRRERNGSGTSTDAGGIGAPDGDLRCPR